MVHRTEGTITLAGLHSRHFLSLLVTFLYCVPLLSACPAWGLSTSELYRHGKNATVLIIAIDDEAHALSFGSGVFISQAGLLLTNAHVIHESTRILIYGEAGTRTSIPEVVAVDPDLDLAALRVTNYQPVSYLSLAGESPEDGAAAVTIGYPRLPDVLQMGLTIHPTVFPVTVSGEATGQSRITHRPLPFLHITGLMNAGSSGGPLVNESGQILGLVVHTVPYLESAKNIQGESIGRVMLRAGLSYCIPSSRIREWLGANSLAFEKPDEPSIRASAPAAANPSGAAGLVATAQLLQLMADVIRKDAELLDMAIRHYETALGLEPNRPDILHDLGRALASKGNIEEAWATYKSALEALSDDAGLLTDAGDLRRQQRQFNDAEALYRKALGKAPCYLQALLSLGTILSEQGKAEDAKRVFQVAAHCPPPSSLAAYQLGLELERQGESVEALSVWEQALVQPLGQGGAERNIMTRIRHRASRLKSRLPTSSLSNLAASPQ